MLELISAQPSSLLINFESRKGVAKAYYSFEKDQDVENIPSDKWPRASQTDTLLESEVLL